MAVAEAKSERIELRTTRRAKSLLQRAAAASHKNMSDFLIDSALRAAEQALLERRVFRLNATQWREFQDFLDRPVKRKARLNRLLTGSSVIG
ncbi:MAG: DUF1778 domain-containing protein [Rhodospirillaceae bacterium]|nr:DUF1778 domain-containing protein [Rhodospirillaceae bacterium]